jgi:16S rRNA (cytosine967-C5)-methyltransferase
MTEKSPGGGAGPSSGAVRFVLPADGVGGTASGLPADPAPDAGRPAGTGAPSPGRLPRVPIGGITDSRVAAADVLADLRGGELLDAAFDRRAGRLDARDRRWTQELVYGTLRRRAWIDSLLLTRVRGGLARLDADVTDLLRLGTYQLLHMGSVPAYAAIAQTVELTKQRHGIGASRLANAVLRRLDRERAEGPSALDAVPPTDPLDALALAFSHPRWLIARWVARWGAEEAAALLEANNAEAPVVLRPYGIVREQLEAMLEAAGVQHEEAPFVRDSIQLRVTPALTELGAYRQGLFFVQDPAATLVTQYACVAPGSLVVDLCAAPGGKALELSRAASLVVAADRSMPREQRLRGNLRRVEARNVVSVVADAMSPPFAPADAVLLDAPCTGTGTFRRHPDSRWRLKPSDLAVMAAMQRALLRAAARIVRPGGLLIYSTCSLEIEENDAQIESFLADHPDWVLEPPPEGVVPAAVLDAGRLRTLPQRHAVDGAFAARLRRAGGAGA